MSAVNLDNQSALKQVACLEDVPAASLLGKRNRFMNKYWHSLAMTPFIIALSFIFLVLPKSSNQVQLILGLPALIWAGAIPIYALVVKAKLFRIRCPRCGERFGLGAICSSCGLPRSPKPDQSAEDQFLARRSGGRTVCRVNGALVFHMDGNRITQELRTS